MIELLDEGIILMGVQGVIPVRDDDEITIKLAMLFEGECEGKGPSQCAKKFGYSRQRYHQLLNRFVKQGAEGLRSQKRGPKSNYRRTDEVVRQIIRHRFLDPQISPEVIAQKLIQAGQQISQRSVERVIGEYGLQKKNYT
jgi:transposase